MKRDVEGGEASCDVRDGILTGDIFYWSGREGSYRNSCLTLEALMASNILSETREEPSCLPVYWSDVTWSMSSTGLSTHHHSRKAKRPGW